MILQRVVYALQLNSLPVVVEGRRRRRRILRWRRRLWTTIEGANECYPISSLNLPRRIFLAFFSGCSNLFRAHRHRIACIHEFSFINKYHFMGQESRYADEMMMMLWREPIVFYREISRNTNNAKFNNTNRWLSCRRVEIKGNQYSNLPKLPLRGLIKSTEKLINFPIIVSEAPICGFYCTNRR